MTYRVIEIDPASETIEFDINVSISALATYTETIDLSNPYYTKGIMTAYINDTIARTKVRRFGCVTVFGTALNDAFAANTQKGNNETIEMLYGVFYSSYDSKFKGGWFTDDARLSFDNAWASDSNDALNQVSAIDLVSAQIVNNDQVELKWKNFWSGSAFTLAAKGNVRVFR